MRVATGGLAARHNTMPPSISAPTAASVRRSTVRHHSLSTVGCAREAIVKLGPPEDPAYSCSGHGFQAIKIVINRRMTLDVSPARLVVFLQSREGLDQRPERVAPYFEVAILVERGAGRRKQHQRLGGRRGGSVARRRGERLVERSGDFVRDGIRQGGGELIGRLADEIGLADTREKRAQAFDAAGLGPPAGDPENIP